MDILNPAGFGQAIFAGEGGLLNPILVSQGRPTPIRFRVRLTTSDFARVPVARVLINTLGCSAGQAVPATRRLGDGVLAEGLTAEIAQRLCEGLGKIGVSVSIDAHLA